MKLKYFFRIILIISLSLINSACTDTITRPVNNYLFNLSIYGQIVDNTLFSTPIAGASVRLNDKGAVNSDLNGSFIINSTVQIGQALSITISKEGYQTREIALTAQLAETTIDLQQIILALSLENTQISGQVSKTNYYPGHNINNYLNESNNDYSNNYNNDSANNSIIHSINNSPGDNDYTSYLLKFKTDDEAEIDTLPGKFGFVVDRYIPNLDLYLIKPVTNNISENLQLLASHPLVDYLEANPRVEIEALPADPLYQKQWNLEILNMPPVWDITTGESQIIAVIDTGISLSHPDLAVNILPGIDLADGDNDPTDYNPEYSHGTHVAGIIAAATNNIGISGTAPTSKILPVKIFKDGETGTTVADLAAGIHYAADHNVSVINISLGTNSTIENQTLYQAVCYAYEKDIPIVSSAGNSSGDVLYPAKYDRVIAVGAVNIDQERALYSNTGSSLEIMAPGGDITAGILSTFHDAKNGDDYGYLFGTSMAAPHVSAIIALLKESLGPLSVEEIREVICSTALDLGDPGFDNYTGYGLINPQAIWAIEDLNEDIMVFAGFDDGKKISIHSPIVLTDQQGKYQLNQISPGSWQLIGWQDLNENKLIDQGDYFGRGPEITVSPVSLPILENVNFSIEYLTNSLNREVIYE